MAEPTQPAERMVLGYFIVSDDVERSRRFYTEVLGGRVVFGPEPTNVALANAIIIINGGGGPTDDKPTVTLETPRDPDRVSSFLNIRVTDIHAVYAEWSARGAQFLTPPKQHQYEIRCYIRDPDGYIIEVGQTTDPQGDWWPADWPPIELGSGRTMPKGVRDALGLVEGDQRVFRVEGKRALLARTPSLLVVDEPMPLRALEVCEVERIDVSEAYLVASAEASGVESIVSFDRSIDRVTTIRRIEPS